MFPQEAHGLSRGFRQLPWNSDTMLSDYLPLVQAAVVKSWLARKKLVATLALRHSVLEYDAQDFTMVHLFMKVCLASLALGCCLWRLFYCFFNKIVGRFGMYLEVGFCLGAAGGLTASSALISCDWWSFV